LISNNWRSLRDSDLKTTKNMFGKTIEVNGRNVHYYTGGRGEPLVVVHGGAGDAASWLDNFDMLIDNFTLFLPDMPGFGESHLLDCEHNIQTFTDFVDDFTHKLGLDKFNLMGHSIGGGVALNYALRFPGKVKKLVLISSLCLGREIALWIRLMSVPAEVIGAVAISVLKTTKWMIDTLMIPVEFVMPFSRASVSLGSNITTLQEQTLVLSDRLSELTMPTLVVWGARDEIVPVKQAYAAAQVIPDCRLKIYENRGHSVYRDDEFSHMVTGFLG
jgi:pimeloyl-ACP methyl ester carboxylesterase